MISKKIIDIASKVLFTSALITLFVLYLQEKKSLAYIDSQKLMVNYKGMQQARAAFEKTSKMWNDRIDTMKMEILELEKFSSSMPTAKQGYSKQDINMKKEELWNYENAIREKIQNEDKILTQEVLIKVNEFIKRFGQKNGYSIILVATQYGNIAYAQEGFDVTDEVLNGLNQEFSK